MARMTPDQIREVVEEVRALNLPTDSFWAMVEERLGLESGDVFHFIAEDPVFYGFGEDWKIPRLRR